MPVTALVIAGGSNSPKRMRTPKSRFTLTSSSASETSPCAAASVRLAKTLPGPPAGTEVFQLESERSQPAFAISAAAVAALVLNGA